MSTPIERRFVLSGLAALSLAGCSLPRNAPQRREVLAVPDGQVPDFALREVRRDTLAEVKSWPAVGRGGPLGWPSPSGGNRAPVLAPGDRIDLRIWDAEETSLITSPGQQVRDMPGLVVSPGGTIFLPYVDQVRVAGLTTEGARRKVQESLTTIIPSAQVQLTHVSGRRNSMDMVSGVSKPGAYPIDETAISVLAMISLAGGVSGGLKNPQVRLIRGSRVYRASLAWISEDPRRDIVLQGNDRIIVEEDSRSFIALGATGKQEVIGFGVDHLSALRAMSMMGGVNDARADLKGILVLRQYPKGRYGGPKQPPNERVVFAFDLTSADGLFSANEFQIMPGDVVLATQSPVTSVERVLTLLGRAFGLANTVSNI
jgi:polysaccharide export outer membrane protein